MKAVIVGKYLAEAHRAIDQQPFDPKDYEQLVLWDEDGIIGDPAKIKEVTITRIAHHGGRRAEAPDIMGATTPNGAGDPASETGWPDLPRHWKLFSFVLPRTARERYFAHSYEDMVIAYGEATRLVRTPGERRWILFSFGLRSMGLYTGSIAAACRDVLVAALRWLAILAAGRQAAGRLIAWIEKILICS